MKLNRRQTRRLIESILQEKAEEPKSISDLLLAIYRDYTKEIDAFNPIVLAHIAVANGDMLMSVYNKGSKSGEDPEAGIKAVFEKMQELAKNVRTNEMGVVIGLDIPGTLI